MRLNRIAQQQNGPDIRAFYIHVLKFPKPGMLTVLDLLEEAEPRELTVFFLLSHSELCLLSADDFRTRRWIKIDQDVNGRFVVKCRVPDRIAPWPHAYVRACVETPQEVIAKVSAGISFSEGWST